MVFVLFAILFVVGWILLHYLIRSILQFLDAIPDSNDDFEPHFFDSARDR